MKKICFIIAMQAEGQPLIEHFGMKQLPHCFGNLPMKAYQSQYKDIEISLILNGQDAQTGLDHIGCEAATLATHLAITNFHPDLLINAGTAGGFMKKGARIGDVYLSHKYIVFHDRRVSIGAWQKMGFGYYPCFDSDTIAKVCGYKQGICTTGSSLDLPEIDLQQMQKTEGEIKYMEAAAIAWVADLYRATVLFIKSITDLVDSGRPTAEEFNENIHLAAQKVKEACFRIIDFFASQNKQI